MGGLTMVAVESPKPTIESDRDRLWETWENLELPPGSRAEILRGEIIVSPSPMSRHNLLFAILIEQLVPVTQKRRWAITNTESIKLPATDEAVIPDLIVVPREALDNDEEWLIGPEDIQLIVEITSGSPRDRDLTTKLSSYARAGIPNYLIVDRLEGDGIATIYFEPSDTGVYRRKHAVEFGKPLPLPEPFDIELDTDEFKSKRTRG